MSGLLGAGAAAAAVVEVDEVDLEVPGAGGPASSSSTADDLETNNVSKESPLEAMLQLKDDYQKSKNLLDVSHRHS